MTPELQAERDAARADADALYRALWDYELEHRTQHRACDDNPLHADGIANARKALAAHEAQKEGA